MDPKKRVVIYTASFGGHDRPSEFHDAGCDLVCFTDQDLELETWQVMPFDIDRPDLSPRLQAKVFKMSAVAMFGGQYDYSIWLDASFWAHHGAGFAEHCLAHLHDGLAFYPHPAEWRSLEQEALISQRMPKYAGEDLVGQVQRYRDLGLAGGKLLCGGVIARAHTPDVARLESRWLEECKARSPQDQLSLPFCLWKEGLRPGLIPGDIYSNEFLVHLWSGTKR